MKRVALKIYGRVQGVFFRHNAKQKADGLSLTGWVRNEPDGVVAVVAEGTEDALKEFVRWCQKGPPSARVDRVEEEWGEAVGEFRDRGFTTM